MKNKLKTAAVAFMTMASLASGAKGQSGVYLTASDYTNNKLSYAADGKIHLNNSFANMPYITVNDQGRKLKLQKDNLFGFVDGSGKVYRFYQREVYLIAESGSIVVYQQTKHIPQGKGFRVEKKYYFSTSATTEVRPLDLGNLKNALRSNDKVLDILDQFFANADVTAYDSIHNTYKVNYVIAKALR